MLGFSFAEYIYTESAKTNSLDLQIGFASKVP